MSIWGKLAEVAAELGGGPVGSLRSGVGYQEQDGTAENQVAFTVSVIALGAKVAKAQFFLNALDSLLQHLGLCECTLVVSSGLGRLAPIWRSAKQANCSVR